MKGALRLGNKILELLGRHDVVIVTCDAIISGRYHVSAGTVSEVNKNLKKRKVKEEVPK